MSNESPEALLTAPTRRPPFDAELEPIAEAIASMGLRISAESLEPVREMARNGVPGQEPVDFTRGGDVVVTERVIPVPGGDSQLQITVLSPARQHSRLPGILHLHGGGMVSGTRMFGVDAYLPFVAEGEAVVVTVDYRLAPEHPDPAPVEDCYGTLVWMAGAATELGIDGDRLIVAGASAGGGLAAGTALMARDRGFPNITHQVLDFPMIDDRFATHSSQMLDGEGTWDRNDNLFGWTALLGDRRGREGVSSYAAPARADDVSGLPATYLACGTADGFRDEALAYADRLNKAGVLVDLHLWGGGFHGFEFVAPDASLSKAAVRTRDDFVRRALAR